MLQRRKTKMKGKCGSCGSDDLDYSSSEPQDESYIYEFTCNKCEKSGMEYYDLVYSETMMNE